MMLITACQGGLPEFDIDLYNCELEPALPKAPKKSRSKYAAITGEQVCRGVVACIVAPTFEPESSLKLGHTVGKPLMKVSSKLLFSDLMEAACGCLSGLCPWIPYL
eukprot:scaffold72194_cov14-Tisochrysis_lutea.AAC.1